MCGIAGIVDVRGCSSGQDATEKNLRAMGDAMEQRGPDDTRVLVWNNVGFIFKRLSIVDLVAGEQPFETTDGRISAMINGEIYNHRELRNGLATKHLLTSGSDCEVVPYLYLQHDASLFDSVNGMFAAALLDRQKNRLLLARDRLGIKPLFYYQNQQSGQLVFASELKALFAHPSVPREFDWDAALSVERCRDTRGRELPSFFQGIKRLRAGHILLMDLLSGELVEQPYWALPTYPEVADTRGGEWYVSRYRELLEESVRKRLMSDVGLGIFLSGGVDSAAIAALAAKNIDLPTFSVCSASTVGSGDVGASRRVARHLGLRNHQVFFDHRSDSISPDHWREVLWACEWPGAGPEQLYKYYLHAYAKHHYPDLKVMLLGQGADEFLGGYMKWTIGEAAYNKGNVWTELGSTMRTIDALDSAIERGYLLGYKEPIENGYLDPDFFARISGRSSFRSPMERYRGYYRQNLDTHLWHEDRTSASNSIESRVPFLDHEVLEFLSSVPVCLHAELFNDKQILRRAVVDLLPPHIATRPKGYFYFGDEQHRTFELMYAVLVGNDRELVEQAIEGSELTDGPLKADGIHKFVSEVGADTRFSQVLNLLSLINMGVLAQMSATLRVPESVRNPSVVRDLSDAEIDRLLAFGRERLPEEGEAWGLLIPELAKGVSLASDPGGHALQLTRNGSVVSRIVSPSWGVFVEAMDGNSTVAGIISANDLPRSRTVKMLRGAVDANLIVLRDR